MTHRTSCQCTRIVVAGWWETPGLDPQQATPASIVDQRMASSFCNKLPPNIIYLTQKLVHAVKVTAQMGHLVHTSKTPAGTPARLMHLQV